LISFIAYQKARGFDWCASSLPQRLQSAAVPTLPSELKILPDVLDRIHRDHEWHTGYFQVVEFYDQ
jgi:hypothetical protein